MPYNKEIGHSPTYTKRCILRLYKDTKTCKGVARHIGSPHRYRIPHIRSGSTLFFEDSYEAYIIEVERMTPWQKVIDHIYL